jgi:DNA-binding MarR family transcriptional regulator
MRVHIGAYTRLSSLGLVMPSNARTKLEVCNCLALREATRHVTQFYDQFLAPSGLRTTQFSILIRLRLAGPMTINALAKSLVMDRTTLGRNILPLEREGLIEIVPGSVDRRSKVVHLTEVGAARLRAARAGWSQAQKNFETAFGRRRATHLRTLLHAVTETEFGDAPPAASS